MARRNRSTRNNPAPLNAAETIEFLDGGPHRRIVRVGESTPEYHAMIGSVWIDRVATDAIRELNNRGAIVLTASTVYPAVYELAPNPAIVNILNDE